MFKLNRLLLIIGILCLAAYIGFTVQAYLYQEQLSESFDEMLETAPPTTSTTPKNSPTKRTAPRLIEGDLVGRLEIPRLKLSVMVLEGIKSRTLRLGAGHIPGTSVPGYGGNAAIAGHRDTYFRPLSKIQKDDLIKFRTLAKTLEYRVVSTTIVSPNDVAALQPRNNEELTLVTCYPFYFVGPAPKRFIVTAVKH